MKRLIYFLISTSIYILGCKNDSSNNGTAPKSVKAISKYTDSFINAEQDKIIGVLKFGMSKNEVDDILDKFNKDHKLRNEYYIGKFKYNPSAILKGYDDNGKIFGFVIKSPEIAYSDGKKVFEQLSALENIVEEKYGKADQESSYDKSKLIEGDVNFVNYRVKSWEIGKKTINIFFEGSGVYVICISIFVPKVLYTVQEKEKEIERKKKIKDRVKRRKFEDSIANSAKNVF